MWIRLLIRQELSNDLVHDVLCWEKIIQKLGQNPRYDPSFAGKTLPDSVRTQVTSRQKFRLLTPRNYLNYPPRDVRGLEIEAAKQGFIRVWFDLL